MKPDENIFVRLLHSVRRIVLVRGHTDYSRREKACSWHNSLLVVSSHPTRDLAVFLSDSLLPNYGHSQSILQSNSTCWYVWQKRTSPCLCKLSRTRVLVRLRHECIYRTETSVQCFRLRPGCLKMMSIQEILVYGKYYCCVMYLALTVEFLLHE